MKKIILLIIVIICFSYNGISQQQTFSSKYRTDFGPFCLVNSNTIDTNYFKIDINLFLSKFAKVYFKNYYLEQDVFRSKIISYDIEKNEAIIAVPRKYEIDDYRYFMANLKKMAEAANINYSESEKEAYLLSHK